MAGLESAPQNGIQVSPSELIGRPDTSIVSPQNTQLMIDGFRQGFISTDEIMERVSQRTQKKKELELEQTKNALEMEKNPEVQQARKLAVSAAVSRAKADRAKSERETELGPLFQKAERAKTVLDILNSESFGTFEPMRNAFLALGVPIPQKAEGVPDVDEMQKELPNITAYSQYLRNAAAIAQGLEDRKFKIGEGREAVEVIGKYSPALGRVITDEERRSIERAKTLDFNAWKASIGKSNIFGATPGASQTATAAAGATPVAPASSGLMQSWRDFLSSEGVQNVSGMSDQQVTGLVQERRQKPAAFSGTIEPKKPAAAVKPVLGDTMPGLGTVVSVPSGKPENKAIASEGVEKIDLARGAADISARLQAAYQTLIESEPNLVGFLDGRIATWTKSRQWNTKIADFEREATAILAPLAKGTYNETGVLSDKDIERYRGIIPDIRDNPKVGTFKAEKLFKAVNEAFDRKIDTWRRAGYDISGFSDIATESREKAATPAGTPAAAPTSRIPVSNVPGVGSGFFDPATQRFYPGK